VVCAAASSPRALRKDSGWRCLRLAGRFDLSETGILVSVLAPLARAGVAVFALATYDTDYVLVRSRQWGAARRALLAAGHRLSPKPAQSKP
jgi:hypothetical protein